MVRIEWTMTGAPPLPAAIPAPLDTDDDDVAWALQTAAVQWKLGAAGDALVWLRRAVDAAIDAGHPERAAQINRLEAELSERLKPSRPPGRTDPPASIEVIDELLEVEAEPLGPEDLMSATDDEENTSADVDAHLLEEIEPRAVSLLPYEIEEEIEPVPVSEPRRPSSRPAPRPSGSSRPPAGSSRPPPTPPSASSAPSLRPPRGSVGSRPPVPSRSPTPPPMPSRPPAPERFQTPAGERRASSSSRAPAADARRRSSVAPSAARRPVSSAPPGVAAPATTIRTTDEEEPTLITRRSRSERAPVSPEPVEVEEVTEIETIDEEISPVSVAEPAASAPSSAPAPSSARAPSSAPVPSSVPAPDSAPGRAAAPSLPREGEPTLRGVVLADVQGLQDLPEDAQWELVEAARIELLATEEELSRFAVALVLDGWVSILPAVADAACARAERGEVVFTSGNLDEGVELRVVSGTEQTELAVWDQAALDRATAACPWVADDLRTVADRFQALAGAAMGKMGDRLDDSLRTLVTDRCQVQRLLAGEELVAQGSPVPGMYIVGVGRVELVRENDVKDELGPGDFLFTEQVLAIGPAPSTARAGQAGAVVLFADRKAAHELLVSVPPLLEILAY
ncbi:MAG TPA: cyclic nucleotide-binding domain-containing protein [Kofleriaceae bacterium]|nr:cyclic nucleotide-binding domain-containing protein [Kofleriaceae bacterium]